MFKVTAGMEKAGKDIEKKRKLEQKQMQEYVKEHEGWLTNREALADQREKEMNI